MKALTPAEGDTKDRFASRVRGIESAYPQYRQDLASSLAALPNVAFLGLHDEFDAVAAPVFIDDCHLVDRGCEHLAEAIARVIQ